jgi:hypothetical protein
MLTSSWDRGIPFFTTSVENRDPPLYREVPREGKGKESKNEKLWRQEKTQEGPGHQTQHRNMSRIGSPHTP